MESKSHYHEYIAQVLESEELFIQQMLDLQKSMNNVAQESLMRRQVYEKALKKIEEQEEEEFSRLESSYLQTDANSTYQDLSEAMDSSNRSQTSNRPLTSTPSRRNDSSFGSDLEQLHTSISVQKQGFTPPYHHGINNCQLIPCPHCGKLIQICLCEVSKTVQTNRSGTSKGRESKPDDSSKFSGSTLWEEQFSMSMEPTGDSSTFQTTNTDTSGLGTFQLNNKSHSKHVLFSENISETKFFTSSNRDNEAQKLEAFKPEVMMQPILPKDKTQTSQFSNPLTSKLNSASQHLQPSTPAKGDDLHRRLVNVLSRVPKPGSNTTSLQSLIHTTTLPVILKNNISGKVLSDSSSKSTTPKKGQETEAFSNSISMRQEMYKTRMEHIASNDLSGYESENSLDSCRTRPFSVKSLSEEDLDNNNNNNTDIVKVDETSVDTNSRWDKKMIEHAWDRIFGTFTPIQEIPVDPSVMEESEKNTDYSILKAIKNLNLSY